MSYRRTAHIDSTIWMANDALLETFNRTDCQASATPVDRTKGNACRLQHGLNGNNVLTAILAAQSYRCHYGAHGHWLPSFCGGGRMAKVIAPGKSVSEWRC